MSRAVTDLAVFGDYKFIIPLWTDSIRLTWAVGSNGRACCRCENVAYNDILYIIISLCTCRGNRHDPKSGS